MRSDVNAGKFPTYTGSIVKALDREWVIGAEGINKEQVTSGRDDSNQTDSSSVDEERNKTEITDK